MRAVLHEAGITEVAEFASALSLSLGWFHTGKSIIGIQIWEKILSKWQDQESEVSWHKLAEAVREKYGVDASQIILEMSGEGIHSYCRLSSQDAMHLFC